MKFRVENSLLILLLFLLFLDTNAQDKKTISPYQPVIDKDCDLTKPSLVQFNVSVWSSKNGYVENLAREDFEIYDGKERQEIKCFEQDNEPTSIGVLFDLSGSMKSSTNHKFSEIPFAVKGLAAFLNKTKSDNDYFFLGFGEKIDLMLDMTKDAKKIQQALNVIARIKPNGNTSFYDTLELGFEKIAASPNRKKVLIAITDGVDNSSRKFDFSDAKKIIKQQDVILYVINILTEEGSGSVTTQVSDGRLSSLVSNSGGSVFYPTNPQQIDEVFEMLAEELKTQYLVGFTAKHSIKGIQWHNIDVKVQIPKEEKKEIGKLSVRTRKGIYF